MSLDNRYGYQSYRCPQCGKGVMSDCGGDFCSTSCENAYENDHAECETCGREVGEDSLYQGKCERCHEYERNEE